MEPDEAVFAVERLGCLVDRMHHENLEPDELVRREHGPQRMSEQLLPHIASLPLLIHGQSSQKYRRD